jgi:hypothetical protein
LSSAEIDFEIVEACRMRCGTGRCHSQLPTVRVSLLYSGIKWAEFPQLEDS